MRSENMKYMQDKIKIIGLVVLVAVVVVATVSMVKKDSTEEENISKREPEVFSKAQAKSIKKMPAFRLEDIGGKEVTEEVFKDYGLTIIIAWQTKCEPCYYELEALNEIYKKYNKKGVNVIGLNLDNPGREKLEEILDELELEYTNLLADKDYINEIVKHVTGTPTALFVDSDGEFIKDGKAGTKGMEESIKEYEKIVEEIIPSKD